VSFADPREHNDAFIALLEAAGLVVGDATKPKGAHGWQGIPGQSPPFIPYVIVHPLGQTFDGSLGCPDTDSDVAWQVTVVGSTREQTDSLKARVDAAVIGQSLTVAGRFVPRIRPEPSADQTRRDDTVQPASFIATPRYAAMST
jgi:hypothetical protein